MATYTPAALIPVVTISSTTTGTASYSAPSATTGIARTFQVQSQASANGFHASFGADAIGTRVFANVALTAAVPAIYNGWWVTASNTASAIQVIATTSTSATVPTAAVAGYTFA